ncbi:hypothetical protein TeGR_g14748, partial [Tetraparma gracilis]
MKLREEYDAFQIRKAAADEKRRMKKEREAEEESIATASLTAASSSKKKLREGDEYDSSSSSSSSSEEEDEEPEEEVQDDQSTYSDEDTTYTRASVVPEPEPLAIFDFMVKCPLPPCCINETCGAFAKDNAKPAFIPEWVQKEWDQQEAAKLAAMYGGAPQDGSSSEEEDDGEHIDYLSELDFGPNKITSRYLGDLLSAVGEKMKPKEMKRLVKRLDKEGTGGIKFLDFIEWMYRLKLSRRKWGGRICITDDAPLPKCCANPACKAHLERPTAADDDEEEERQHHIMWSVFSRHDADSSGELGIEEIEAIFVDHSIPWDAAAAKSTFDKYDLDGSGNLEFEEFCSLMEDLDAASQIVKKRTDAYALPEHMKEWFGPSKLEDLKTQFGIFDDSGDGNISAQELRAVLGSLGTELSHEQVVEIIDMIDADKSGEIEFPEFVSLMRKIEKGEIDIGDSALTQAIMSSKPAVRLQNEVNGLVEDPIPGVIVKKLKKPLKPPTAEVHIEGPPNTPYANYDLVIRLSIPDDYPFSPPVVKFAHRILHINVSMMLDGSCSIPQISTLWDGGWDLRMLIGYVKALIAKPDTRLLPPAIREQYKLEGLPLGFDNDYGIEDEEFTAEQKAKNELKELKALDKETDDAGFVNPFKLEKQPYTDVVQRMLSKPEHDLRGGGLGSNANFLNRAVELYFERPAKFKNLAE